MYVFGVDLPIMELLFLFGVFLFAALVIIWLEIRRLRDLLTAEKANLSTLTKAETQEKSSLDESIKSALKKGYTKQAIKTALVNRGWPENIVNKALEKNSGLRINF